ncbi:MAG: cobalamin-dependent protein [Deltaproteobacteria bacterium]|uniref:Cobalamin-dependent protein n=1 Tax=Candidatus Zymogenus saltonus TaxID=2844893 RepID=A0A9D8PNP5_9DELT|nr:cobalamin-dependent protein [Candidatus Zymogenus saltonus]
MSESLRKIKEAIVELDLDSIKDLVKAGLEDGLEPWEIIKNGMGEGMEEVGKRFDEGEYYLADLILSGEVMKEGMTVLEDKVDSGAMGQKGTVVIATVKGDIHDIGKNIVAMLLSAADFKVIDIGVDVNEADIVKAVKENNADALGLSVLLTTMIGGIRDTVDALKEAGLRDKVKIAIGGACTSDKLAKEMEVDAYGEDAVKSVKIFEQLIAS